MNRPLDDINKRKEFKKDEFDGKRTTTDAYTGKRIYNGNLSNAKHRHSTKTTTDIDHITPIAVVKKRYFFVNENHQKKLANLKTNYAATNSSLNRQKGGKENHSYLRQHRTTKPKTKAEIRSELQ